MLPHFRRYLEVRREVRRKQWYMRLLRQLQICRLQVYLPRLLKFMNP